MSRSRDLGVACKKKMVTKSDSDDTSRHDWTWDATNKTQTAMLVQFNTRIIFHPTYSSGTGAVFGNSPLSAPYHHYWEVAMLSPVYGTDVMIGLATKSVDIATHSHTFASLVGHDQFSWGFSYQGTVHHRGRIRDYGPKWGEGDTVGVHLDTLRGTVEFYLNKKPLGVAFKDLRVKEDLFPLVSSTAAKSEMKLETAQSYKNNLQFSCLKVLSSKLPGSNLLNLYLPPGLKKFIQNNYWFFVDLETKVEEGLMIVADTPPHTSAFPFKSADDQFVPNMNSLKRKGTLDLPDDSSESEDNDSFHVRPTRFRKAKLALMKKCQAGSTISGRSRVSSPECHSQDLAVGKCATKIQEKIFTDSCSVKVQEKGASSGNSKDEVSNPPRKKRFRLMKPK